MENIKELYVLERPVETKIGFIHPALVEDYHKLLQFDGVLGLDKNALIHHFTELTNQDDNFQPFLDIINELDMLDFIKFCGIDEYEGSLTHGVAFTLSIYATTKILQNFSILWKKRLEIYNI